MAIELVGLTGALGRKAFDCGYPKLNEYFRRFAWASHKRHSARTMVAVDGDAVVAFVTYVGSEIEGRHYKEPVLRLARLGVALSHQKSRVGGLLMLHVFERAIEARSAIGCVGVVVDAKRDTEADRYYARYGFEPLTGGDETSVPMFLGIAKIERAKQLASGPNSPGSASVSKIEAV
jgi:GNAT superfamily N-acetyltransferase